MNKTVPERTWSAPPSFSFLEEPSTSSDQTDTRPSTAASCDDSIFKFPSEREKVIGVAMSILIGKQAIPIRVKILLDKALSLLSEEEIVDVLKASSWTWLDYCRGYKLEEQSGIAVSDWQMVDELSTMDRFNSFQLCSPLLQNFRTGFLTPWNSLMAPVTRPMTEARRDTLSSSSDERVKVTDSPSPSPTATVVDESSPAISGDSLIEESSDMMKMKKRVTCEVCQKSFCDKGALKIHTSAVHLKEMHKCTVPGCEKEFSSRRSRNRHSSNANPKLHMQEGSQPPTFRDQVALSMSMVRNNILEKLRLQNGLTGTAALMGSPLQTGTGPTNSPNSTSPCSSPITSRKRKADEGKTDFRPLDLTWRKAGLPLPAKLPYTLPATDQMLLALQLLQAQPSAFTGFLNNFA